tara:strand:+ start:97 stop:720 length:624 start_codon:yes stop_codon:yes gene_type:complete
MHVRIIEYIQRTLSIIYSFDLDYHVKDFILSEAPHDTARACTLFKFNDGCIDIGIYIPKEIILSAAELKFQSLPTKCELQSLSILIEEVSHFYMIINSIKENRRFRLIELEWQAEIDKIIILGSWLRKLTGCDYWNSLEKFLFTSYEISSPEPMRYKSATEEAEKFWKDLRTHTKGNLEAWTLFREYMTTTYRLPWEAKKTRRLLAA